MEQNRTEQNRTLVWALVLAALGATACQPEAAPLGREVRITAHPPAMAAVHAAGVDPSSETSVVWSLNQGPTDQTVVVGFNDYGVANLGWAWTEDIGEAPGERTWTYCNSSDPRFLCGGPVPLAPGQVNFIGDPYLAAANDNSGTVVYTQMADGPNQPAGLIVAAISRDGGRTFANTVRVNDDGCSGGAQDQQAAAFDHTTSPPTLWVAWRHRNVTSIPGTYGACVRGGTVDPVTATVDWLGPSRVVSNLATETTFNSIGGLYVEAGDGAVMVAYLQQYVCDLASPSVTARYWSNTTTDGGVSWRNAERLALDVSCPVSPSKAASAWTLEASASRERATERIGRWSRIGATFWGSTSAPRSTRPGAGLLSSRRRQCPAALPPRSCIPPLARTPPTTWPSASSRVRPSTNVPATS